MDPVGPPPPPPPRFLPASLSLTPYPMSSSGQRAQNLRGPPGAPRAWAAPSTSAPAPVDSESTLSQNGPPPPRLVGIWRETKRDTKHVRGRQIKWHLELAQRTLGCCLSTPNDSGTNLLSPAGRPAHETYNHDHFSPKQSAITKKWTHQFHHESDKEAGANRRGLSFDLEHFSLCTRPNRARHSR